MTVAAKLDRVPKNIEAIECCVNTYSASCPPRLVPDAHGKATLDRSIPPPVDIAVLIGESVYQMRSALDHLAFDLVKFNASSVPLPSDWEEKCQFPIVTKLKSGQVAPLPYGYFKDLPGISTQAHTFIEEVQPYYGTGQVNNCLRMLNDLCNIDKHRHLALTRGRTQVSEVRTWASGNQSSSWMALDHGAEIDIRGREIDGDHAVEVDFVLCTFVAFDEPVLGAACEISVQEVLRFILGSLQGIIIPAFDKLIPNR